MANIIVPPSWRIPERFITAESTYNNRRDFLKALGFTGAGLLSAVPGGLGGLARAQGAPSPGAAQAKPFASLFPAKRNPGFNPDWKLTDAAMTATYNNYYEFSTQKNRVHQLVDRFKTAPWPVEVYGLCENPIKVDIEQLAAEFGLEERVYRFRCVEAWGMIVPWTGFQLSRLLEKVKPKAEARFVRFETVLRKDEMPGAERLLRQGYPLPYNEGLRLDEALNPLTLVATGIYGKPLPKQNGAPARLVVPWKYGYKSIKSIVKIELVAKQPATLWETLAPDEYPFESNVDPKVPHPRWSQAGERMIDTGEHVPTQLYNGYAEQVRHLYKKA